MRKNEKLIKKVLAFMFYILVFGCSPAQSKRAEAEVFRAEAADLIGKDNTKALELLDRAIKTDPKYAGAYNNRGNVYRDQKRYDMAIADYSQAITVDPKYAMAYSNRGKAYRDKEQYDMAIADFTQVITLAPKEAATYIFRGDAYSFIGEYDKAIADYTQALSIDPDNTAVKENLAITKANLEAVNNPVSVKELENGEFQILSSIQFYDRDLEEIESMITYSHFDPGSFFGDNALFLIANNAVLYTALAFGDAERKDFIEIIKKCIEWSEIAKKNDVHALTREVKTDVGILGTTQGHLDPLFANFIFSIREINGEEETILIVNYRTTNEENAYNQGSSFSQGRFFVIKEQDFNNLKRIFSDDFLAQIDKMAEEKKAKIQLFQ